jgi:WD40 repeat protein
MKLIFFLLHFFRQFLATSSKDRTVRVWNLSTKSCYAIGEGHADAGMLILLLLPLAGLHLCEVLDFVIPSL